MFATMEAHRFWVYLPNAVLKQMFRKNSPTHSIRPPLIHHGQSHPARTVIRCLKIPVTCGFASQRDPGQYLEFCSREGFVASIGLLRSKAPISLAHQADQEALSLA